MKILILKPSSLGDVIQALPVLRLLRLHYPNAEIHWWIDSALAPLLQDDTDLNGVVRFERRRWAKPRHWPEMFRSLHGLRSQHFDLVIDLQSLLRSALFAWGTRGDLLVGLDDPREGANGFYDIAVPRKSFLTHAVDWYLDVLPAIGVAKDRPFTWIPARPKIAQQVRDKWFPTLPSKLIALQPGARWLNKRWPIAHFKSFVSITLQQHPEAKFLILGGKDDRQELGEPIAQTAPHAITNLAGETSLSEMIELVRISNLLITNDTGPMHAAAALKVPLIALFGPTTPERTGPYGQLSNVLRHPLACAPCMKSTCRWERPLECLTAITPHAVWASASKFLH